MYPRLVHQISAHLFAWHHVFCGVEYWSGVESNFGVEYLGYLMHILALNMFNICSRCFKSMPKPDVS